MKRIHTLFIMLTLCLCIGNQQAHAQNWKQILADKEQYLTGEGWGDSDTIADANALADLVSQITVVVKSNFTIDETEKNQNNVLDASTYIESKINTYSNATLHNTDRVVIEKGPKAHVLRYIKRSEINRIFEGRRRKVQEHLHLGEEAEKKLKMGDALRHYYLAFTLLKTLQYPNDVYYPYYKDTTNKHQVAAWLPWHMKGIVDDIRVEQQGREGNNIELWFTYKGEPVVDLEFTCYDGVGWSNLNSVTDGRGWVELGESYSPKSLSLTIEYTYQSIAGNLDVEEGEVMTTVYCNPWFNATKSVNLTPIPPVSVPKLLPVIPSVLDDAPYKAIVEMTNDALYRKMVEEVVAAIRSGNYHTADHCFTAEGLKMYNCLLSYGTPHIFGQPNYKIYDKGDAVVARSVAMSFSFKKGVKKTLVEDVVFTFDKSSRKIECLAFALDKKAADDILSQGYWPESARMTILEFMENYKTAYCFKRTNYLDSIFDDDAYIIVGHVVNRLKRDENGDFDKFANHHLVTYTQYSKKQYIEHLHKCFSSNECVNIHFSNNDVIKSGTGGELYGIQIKQDYYSTNYGDTGYLFLLVDLDNPDKPIIKVRTWQEEPDPKEGLISIYDFMF